MLAQYLLYNLGGASSYGISLLLTWSIVNWLGFYSSWQYAAVLGICFLYLGLWHVFVTFSRQTQNIYWSLSKFACVFVVFAAVNVWLTSYFIFELGYNYLFSISLISLAVSVVTFLINRALVFNSVIKITDYN